jgi:hypothetical protein
LRQFFEYVQKNHRSDRFPSRAGFARQITQQRPCVLKKKNAAIGGRSANSRTPMAPLSQ